MSRQIKDGKKTQRGQKKTRAEVETRIDAEANEVWKGHLNLDNFIVIREDIPNSLEVKISMGFKNPTVTENTSKTITGQNLYVDWFRAKEIMAKPIEELYNAYMAEDKTDILE